MSAPSPARTHVLVLLDSLEEMGGAESLAVDLVTGLDPGRYRRSLCVTRWTDQTAGAAPGRAVVARLRDAGVEVVGLRRRSRGDLRPWLEALRFIRRERVDVIHAHKYGSNAWAVLLGRLGRVKRIIAHEHMWSYAESTRLRRLVDRYWIARGASAFIAVSKEGKRDMVAVEGVRERDITYIPNGVPELPPGDGRRIRDELGLGDPCLLVGTLANLRPEKALEVLIEATALVCAERDDVRLLIAGSGEELERLQGAAASAGVAGKVFFLGYRTDTEDILAALDVAVCCSDFEGGPLSVMEYMDAGLAIVATRVGGLPELVIDGETGLLVPKRDAVALAGAIGELLGDAAARERLGAAGRRRKRELHGQETWLHAIEGLYRDAPAPSRQMAS